MQENGGGCNYAVTPYNLYSAVKTVEFGNENILLNMKYQIKPERELKKVLLKGEKRYLNWKHNLGQGAVSNEIALEDLPGELIMLAEKVNNALQLRFASVDVIFSDGSWKVLEVNSGVMMEHFAGECPEHYKKAKEIYREAVLRMFL